MNTPVLFLKSSGAPKFKNQPGYYLHDGHWHAVGADGHIPKGAPQAHHPEAAGYHPPAVHFAPAEWESLKLPDTNVNAPGFNKGLEKLKEWSDAGNVTAIVGAGYGTNTYGKKLAIIANKLLGMHGSAHKVEAGQKAGEHAVAAGPTQSAAPAPAPEVAAPAPAPAPIEPTATHGTIPMPEFQEGKNITGVKEYYEKVAQLVIDQAHASNVANLETMKASGLKPNAKGKVSNTWAGKTANSKILLALHAQALEHAKGAPAPAPVEAATDPLSVWVDFNKEHWGKINEPDDITPFVGTPNAGPAALAAYGSGAFVELNADPNKPESKALLDYVDQLPQFDSKSTLHRVLGFNSASDVDGYLKQLQPAQDTPGTQAKTVSSWTTQDPTAHGQTPMNNIALDLAASFGDHKVFLTLEPGHKSAKDVSFLYSKDGKSKPGYEVLLPVKTKLDVVSIKKDGDSTYVVVSEVHEGDTKPAADGGVLTLKNGHWVGKPKPAAVPDGWEGSAKSVITKPGDSGGMVDENAAGKGWFVLANNDAANAELKGKFFPSQADAVAALNAALAPAHKPHTKHALPTLDGVLSKKPQGLSAMNGGAVADTIASHYKAGDLKALQSIKANLFTPTAVGPALYDGKAKKAMAEFLDAAIAKLSPVAETVAVADFKTDAMAPTLSKKAFTGSNQVWHSQQKLGDVVFSAGSTMMGQGANDHTKKMAAQIKAAHAAGYKANYYKTAGLQSVYVLEKDGQLLTEHGAEKLVEGSKPTSSLPPHLAKLAEKIDGKPVPGATVTDVTPAGYGPEPESGPKEGDTKPGANGATLVLKNGHWVTQSTPPAKGDVFALASQYEKMNAGQWVVYNVSPDGQQVYMHKVGAKVPNQQNSATVPAATLAEAIAKGTAKKVDGGDAGASDDLAPPKITTEGGHTSAWDETVQSAYAAYSNGDWSALAEFAQEAAAAITEPGKMAQSYIAKLQANAPTAKPGAVTSEDEKNLAALFPGGQPNSTQPIVPPAPPAESLAGALSDAKAAAKAELVKWTTKQYKPNSTSVELAGDGPKSGDSISIGAINEGKKSDAIAAASHEIGVVESLETTISTKNGANGFAALLHKTMIEAQSSAALDGKKAEDVFEYLILQKLGIQPSKGAYLSNGLSKALRALCYGEKAAAPSPAATPGALSPGQLGNLQSIPWFKQKLPDTNTNAKSHNAAVAKIEAMAFAGDAAGLSAFASSKENAKQTYAKKQYLLAVTAMAALQEGGAAPAAAPAPAATKGPYFHKESAIGGLGNEGIPHHVTNADWGTVEKLLNLPTGSLQDEDSTTFTIEGPGGAMFSVYKHGGNLSVRTSGPNNKDETATAFAEYLKANAKPAPAAEQGPKEGDTKMGADGMLVLKNGHWVKMVEDAPAAPKAKKLTPGEAIKIMATVPGTASGMKVKLKALAVAGDVAGLEDFIVKHPTLGQSKLAAKKLIAAMTDGTPETPQSAKKSAPKAAKVAMPTSYVPTEPGAPASMDHWAQVGPQGGSNPGGKFRDHLGQDWYCKFPADADIAKSEVLAAKLYELAGVTGQDAKLVTKDGKLGIASKWTTVKKADSPSALAAIEGVQQGFMVDAWLGNWDVVGLGYDNLQVGADGKAVRVDAGGSLEYRAQGAKKPFGNKVDEIDTLRNAAINPQSAKVFGSMTEADLTASAAKVGALSDDHIRFMVGMYGPGTEAEKKALADTLIARKADILARYPNAAPKEEPPAAPVYRIPSAPDFENWKGAGQGLSSKPAFNKQNQELANKINELGNGGDVDALKNMTYQPIDSAGAPSGDEKLVLNHSSSHIPTYLKDVIHAMTTPYVSPKLLLKDAAKNMSAAFKAVSLMFPGFSALKEAAQSIGRYAILGSAKAGHPLEGWKPKLSSKKQGTINVQAMYDQSVKNFNTLSGTEKQSIKDYTGNKYDDMNAALLLGKSHDMAYNAIQAMKKASIPLPAGTVLSRRFKFNKALDGTDNSANHEKAMAELLAHGEGAVLQEFGLISTSTNSMFWGGKVHLKITAGEGVKGLYVDYNPSTGGQAISSNPGENEIILPYGTRFLVTKIHPKGHKFSDETGEWGKKYGDEQVIEVTILPNL